jgi:hypothetical protein
MTLTSTPTLSPALTSDAPFFKPSNTPDNLKTSNQPDMNTTSTPDIIATLEQRIADELTPIDREERFREMLDDSGTVTVAGMEFWPSRIIEEMDPTAFRCGVNDYADGEAWVEVGTNTYEQDKCEELKEEFVSELESRVSDLEAEISDEDGDGAPEHQEELAELNESLRLLNAHSF